MQPTHVSNIPVGMIFNGQAYELSENRYGVTVTAPDGRTEWMAGVDLELAADVLMRRHVAGKRIVIETAV